MEVAFSGAALALVGFGVLCSTAELAAQAWEPEARHEVTALVPSHLLRPDERLGWSPEPGAVGISASTGRPVTYRINAGGQRDEPVSLTPTPGVYRIVMIGGGAAFGEGVAIEDHFSVGIERDLELVEVANLGVPDFSTGQALLRLRHEGLAYAPDLVLAFVDDLGGDADALAPPARRKPPRFTLAEGALVLARPAELADGLLAGIGGRLERWLARHSNAYHLLGDGLHGVRATGLHRPPLAHPRHTARRRAVGPGRGARGRHARRDLDERRRLRPRDADPRPARRRPRARRH
ncbi:MAG: hypothetical protein CMJ84_10390 [Planctomycetes bacterium]|jgi:hypothetical protein|nr:hypothetical protein [Planctomycetota bacterium]